MNDSRTFKTFLLSFGKILTRLMGLLGVVFLARIFSKEEYATYRQSLMVYTYAAPILTLGLPQALYYFLPNQPRRRKNLLANNMLMLTISGLLFALTLLLGGADFLAHHFNNVHLSSTLRIMAVYPLFVLPVAGMSACLMVVNRVRQIVWYTVISRLIMLMLVLAFVYIWATPKAGVIGYVISAAITALPAYILMKASADTGTFSIDIQGMKNQLRVALPLGFSGMVAQLSLNLDKILIAKYFDPDTFAVYINGAMEIPLIGIITGSATAVILPDLTRLIGEGSSPQALDLWKGTAVKTSLFIFPVMGFLMALAPEVMSILYGETYTPSAMPFRVYLLLLPVRVAFFNAIFIAMGLGRLMLFRTLVGLLANLALSLILIRMLGYMGVAWGTVIACYVWSTLFSVWYMCRKFHVPMFHIIPLQKMLKPMAISCIGAILIYLLKLCLMPNSFLRVAVLGLTYLAWIAVFMGKHYNNVIRYFFASFGR